MEKKIEASRNYTLKPDLSMFNMHSHDTYEIYCFISGNAKYFVEGTIYELKPGDILIMKKAEAHTLLINKCMPYERIIVNFNSEAILEEFRNEIISFIDQRPLGTNNRYPISLFKDNNWLKFLDKICYEKDINTKRLYLTVLLEELKENYSKIHNNETVKDDLIDIINYINRHLKDELSLEKICNKFYISKPHLNRKFKQVIGSTVWEYITTKRLLLAKGLLEKGQRPTDVYIECGYNDYCSFYKAYKNKFGSSPKENYKNSH